MNVATHPYGALQIMLDEQMEGVRMVCSNPNCRTCYAVKEDEDDTCQRCGWYMAVGVCKYCSVEVTNANFAVCERPNWSEGELEEPVCDACARTRIVHIANECPEVRA